MNNDCNIEQVTLADQNHSKKFAKRLATDIQAGSIIVLTGDLGAGKTLICREIIKTICGPRVVVPSPTFNLLQIYQASNFEIYHFDLYRLKNKIEIYELGIEEAWNQNVCLIEWPEIIEDIIPLPYIKIEIKIISNITRSCLIKYLN